MEFLKEILGEELYAQVAAKLEGNDSVKVCRRTGSEGQAHSRTSRHDQKL